MSKTLGCHVHRRSRAVAGLPESGQVYAVETAWLRDGGDWLLEMANWEPVTLPDLPSVIDYD